MKQFIVKSRPRGVGRYNKWMHKRPITYGKWRVVAKFNCACEAEKKLREISGVGTNDRAVFYGGQRLTQKMATYYSREQRALLVRKDLM